jgi:hypothetical protein
MLQRLDMSQYMQLQNLILPSTSSSVSSHYHDARYYTTSINSMYKDKQLIVLHNIYYIYLNKRQCLFPLFVLKKLGFILNLCTKKNSQLNQRFYIV